MAIQSGALVAGLTLVISCRDGALARGTSHDDPGWDKHPPGTLAKKIPL